MLIKYVLSVSGINDLTNEIVPNKRTHANHVAIFKMTSHISRRGQYIILINADFLFLSVSYLINIAEWFWPLFSINLNEIERYLAI